MSYAFGIKLAEDKTGAGPFGATLQRSHWPGSATLCNCDPQRPQSLYTTLALLQDVVIVLSVVNDDAD